MANNLEYLRHELMEFFSVWATKTGEHGECEILFVVGFIVGVCWFTDLLLVYFRRSNTMCHSFTTLFVLTDWRPLQFTRTNNVLKIHIHDAFSHIRMNSCGNWNPSRELKKNLVRILTLTLSHWLPSALFDAYSFVLNSNFCFRFLYASMCAKKACVCVHFVNSHGVESGLTV